MMTYVRLFVVLWVALLAGPALAQEEPAKVSEAQAELNDKAVDAVIQGDLEAALKLFESSLELGPLNITYLNLGRTLTRVGRCDEALVAFDNVASSPKVAAPTTEEIAGLMARYKGEMPELCPGRIDVTCAEPELTMLALDGQDVGGCDVAELSVKPGEHTLRATLEEGFEEHTIQVRGLETSRVSIALKKKPVVVIPEDPPPESGLSLTRWGQIVMGTGGVAVLAGLALDQFVIGPDLEELDSLQGQAGQSASYDSLKSDVEGKQTIAAGLFIAGGALVVTGAVLWVLDPGAKETQPKGAAAPIQIWGSPNEVGAAWSTAW